MCQRNACVSRVSVQGEEEVKVESLLTGRSRVVCVCVWSGLLGFSLPLRYRADGVLSTKYERMYKRRGQGDMSMRMEIKCEGEIV